MRSRTVLSLAAAMFLAAPLSVTKAIKKGKGTASFTTVNGQKLWAMMNGPMNVVLKNAKGGISNISTYDVVQSNGVIHVVDHVLMPM